MGGDLGVPEYLVELERFYAGYAKSVLYIRVQVPVGAGIGA